MIASEAESEFKFDTSIETLLKSASTPAAQGRDEGDGLKLAP
jgi:hypothetical protein